MFFRLIMLIFGTVFFLTFSSKATTVYLTAPGGGIFGGRLLKVNTITGETTIVGRMSEGLASIAISPNGQMYTTGSNHLFSVNKETAETTDIGHIGIFSGPGIAFHPDGTLYIAAGGTLYSINLDTGRTSPVLNIPFATVIAINKDGLVYLTHNDVNRNLYRLDLSTGISIFLGRINSFSLTMTFVGDTLLGFDSRQQVLSINTETALATVLGKTPTGIIPGGSSAYGAAADKFDFPVGSFVFEEPKQFWRSKTGRMIGVVAIEVGKIGLLTLGGAICAGTGGLGCAFVIPTLVSLESYFALITLAEVVQITNDPPDSNFQSVFIPRNYTAYQVSLDPNLPPELIENFNFTFSQMAKFHSSVEAWRITLERYQGAVIAGDTKAAQMQLSALEGYISATSPTAAGVSNAMLSFNEVLLTVIGEVQITEADAITGMTDLSVNGLSSITKDVLTNAGFTETEMDILLTQFLSREIGEIPSSIKDALALTASNINVIANVISCGDFNNDDSINTADLSFFRDHLADPNERLLTIGGVNKCSVIGEPDRCNILDLVVLRRSLAEPALMPGIAPVCLNALGM